MIASFSLATATSQKKSFQFFFSELVSIFSSYLKLEFYFGDKNSLALNWFYAFSAGRLAGVHRVRKNFLET